MKVTDLTEIWGIPKSKLQEYSKQYKWWMVGVYLLDIIAVILLVVILYNSGAKAQFYLYAVGLLCIIITLLMSYKINTDTGVAYQFYNKVQRKDCAVEYYNLNEEVLYNILYCIGYRRLKSNKSLEIYMEMLLSACCDNAKCAYAIMKFMNRYKSEGKDGMAVYVLQGKKKAFLGFVQEGSVLPLDKEDEDTDIKKDTEIKDDLVEEVQESVTSDVTENISENNVSESSENKEND